MKGDNVAGYESKNKNYIFKKPPSTYAATHEGHHPKQHNQLGDEAYNGQSLLQKE